MARLRCVKWCVVVSGLRKELRICLPLYPYGSDCYATPKAYSDVNGEVALTRDDKPCRTTLLYLTSQSA